MTLNPILFVAVIVFAGLVSGIGLLAVLAVGIGRAYAVIAHDSLYKPPEDR